MSNSNLISYTKISPNRTNGRNHTIDTISIHCMAGNLTIERCGEIFASSSKKASSNYGVGTDGRIALYVNEADRSWCTSSSSNDNRAVTIEVANDGGASTGWHVSDKALDSLIKLCADICKRNNIDSLKWKGDKSLIGQVSKQNMTVHRWFANKACPGEYLYNKHSYIATEVNKLLNANVTKETCPYTEPTKTLTEGSKGTEVKWLQWHLNQLLKLNIIKGTTLTVDGSWGSQTSALFLVFQTKYPSTGTNNKPDGKCGSGCRAKLKSLV